MDIHIAAFIPTEINALMDLFNANSPKYFALSERNDFERYLKNEVEDYFTVYAKHKIVGCGGMNYKNNRKVAILSWDIIHPAYQKRGIGSRLLQHRLQIIQQEPGIERISIRTSQMTESFYAKNGFRETQRIANYWAPGFDLVEMHYFGYGRAAN